jgi:hypothetical protein
MQTEALSVPPSMRFVGENGTHSGSGLCIIVSLGIGLVHILHILMREIYLASPLVDKVLSLPPIHYPWVVQQSLGQ